MSRLIALIGELILRLGKSALGIAVTMPLLVAAISLASGAFLVAGAISNQGLQALRSFASVEPKAWCLATAFGADLVIYWFVEGMMVALSIYVYLLLKEPILRASAKLKEVLTK